MPELKRVNRELVEELAGVVNQWVTEHVAPGGGVVVTTEKTEGGVTKTVASAAIVEDSKVEWDGGGAGFPTFLSTRLQAEGLARPIICEDKPEPVNLSGMWGAFETWVYVASSVHQEFELAVALNKPLDSEVNITLPDLKCRAVIPGGIPRDVLSSVFLAHAYGYLSYLVGVGKGGSQLKTKGVNRTEITGVSKAPRVIRAGDGETVQDVLKAVALGLHSSGVRLADASEQDTLECRAESVTNRYWE